MTRKQPKFLTLKQVVAIHERSLTEHGGAQGVRDVGRLEAAVIQSQHIHHYLKGDLYDIAAAYAFHIAEAQSYLDGNKRTAIASALIFLELNGIETIGIDPMRLQRMPQKNSTKTRGTFPLASYFVRPLRT